MNPGPQCWECRVLAPGPPGKCSGPYFEGSGEPQKGFKQGRKKLGAILHSLILTTLFRIYYYRDGLCLHSSPIPAFNSLLPALLTPSLSANFLPTFQASVIAWCLSEVLEKEMATHSRALAWRIPWREEPGRLQSLGSQRVGHDRVSSLSLHYLKSRR